jgi:hypothetical protein
LLTTLATTGKLIEPSPPFPSPFGSICRAAHARSIANLGSLFNALTSSLSSVPSGSLNALSTNTPASLFAPPLGPDPFRDQAPAFLPRGQYSGDTPKTAEARRARDVIRRNHRVRERGGEEVSQTPSIRALHRRSSTLSPAPPTSQLQTPAPFLPYEFEEPSQGLVF